MSALRRRTRVALTTRIPVSQAGGIEASVREIAPRIAARRGAWDVRVVNAFSRVTAWNRIPFFGDVLAALVLTAKVARFDVVLVNGGEYAWPRTLRRRDRERTIVVWHGTRAGEIPALAPKMTFALGVYLRLETWLQRAGLRARGQVAVSESTAHELDAAYGPLPRVRTVPNGAPGTTGVRAARDARTRRRVAWIGTNAFKKGLDVALDACERARGRVPDLEFVAIGIAAPVTPGRAWATFAGRLSHRESIERLRSADVLLATSRYEGCSIAIVEALALGVPIVAGPSVSWMIGDAGIAVGTFDPQPYADALASLFESPERLAAMAEAAPIRARAFDWNVAADAYVEEVERCLAAS